jgi:hypothetical protein
MTLILTMYLIKSFKEDFLNVYNFTWTKMTFLSSSYKVTNAVVVFVTQLRKKVTLFTHFCGEYT